MGGVHGCLPQFSRTSARESLPQKPEHGLLMDLRRKEQLIEARPIDHGGEVVVKEKPDFDLSTTIFKHIDEKMVDIVKKKFGVELFWSDSAVARIEKKTAEALAQNVHWANLKALSPGLLRFIREDCEFNCEHADGSFMDHLQYCYEYGSMHMPEHSAIPLFLHSIMGVGTNLFPMKLEQRPILAKLVSASDLAHIEAFPSVLRLLFSGVLPRKLAEMSSDELTTIDELECYRLLGPNMDHDGLVGKSDNEPLKLNKEQFWVHLNYHLIHVMDFMPVHEWKQEINSTAFGLFVSLHRLLKRAGKLYTKVNFDSDAWAAQVPLPKMDSKFSAKIGFRVEYKMKVSGSVFDSQMLCT